MEPHAAREGKVVVRKGIKLVDIVHERSSSATPEKQICTDEGRNGVITYSWKFSPMLWRGFPSIRHVLVGTIIIYGCRAHKTRYVVIGIIIHCSLWNLTGLVGTDAIEIVSKVRNTFSAEDAKNVPLCRGEFFWRLSTELCEVLTEKGLNSSQAKMGKTWTVSKQRVDSLGCMVSTHIFIYFRYRSGSTNRQSQVYAVAEVYALQRAV